MLSLNPLAQRRAAAATEATRGVTLRDERGQLIDAYFHAACGGVTADIASLWLAPSDAALDSRANTSPQSAPSYLRGVQDDYCAGMPHHSWTETFSAVDLQRALRLDPHSDVGARLDNISVLKQDQTGRAALLRIEGERGSYIVSGWDFKLIVGRALGWNRLKSSRFIVERRGSKEFVFRGGGFGHGLGLCQEGAHTMARRGFSYQQILAHYYPGTHCAATMLSRHTEAQRPSIGHRATKPPSNTEIGKQRTAKTKRLLAATRPAFRLHHPLRSSTPTNVSVADFPMRLQMPIVKQHRSSLTSEHFRANFAAQTPERDVALVLRTLEAARADLLQRLAHASVRPLELPPIEVVIHETTSGFVAATGQAAWTAAATSGDGRRIELQPLDVLQQRRRILPTTLRHECAHALIAQLGNAGRPPRWLTEGLAIHFANEGARFSHIPVQNISLDELERQLAAPTASLQQQRELYAAAYRSVSALIAKQGEANVWQRATHR